MRSLKSLLTTLLSTLLGVLITVAVLAAQWSLSSVGDSALLVFELLITVAALGLTRWLIQRADALAQQVGTVRRGSPQEAQADRVLARFDLAETALDQLWQTSFFPAIAGFFLLTSPLAMALHGALLALGFVCFIKFSYSLDKQRIARGYTLDFGRRTP